MRIVLTTVCVAITLYLLWQLRKPISWLLIATFLAVALSPPVNWLAQRMRRGFAITIVYLGLLLIPILLIAAIVPPLITEANNFADNVPTYADDVTEFVQDNKRLREINEDYDITAQLEKEAQKAPGPSRRRRGHARCVVVPGSVTSGASDEVFHEAITGFLGEWRMDRRLVSRTVDIVGENWSGRAYELREALEQCAVPHIFSLADSDRGRASFRLPGSSWRKPATHGPANRRHPVRSVERGDRSRCWCHRQPGSRSFRRSRRRSWSGGTISGCLRRLGGFANTSC